jgi:hypothetical protein
MVAVPILFTVEDSLEIIRSARSVLMGGAPKAAQLANRDLARELQKQATPVLRTLRIDADFAPVPVAPSAASLVFSMSPATHRIGPTAFVARGTIDDSEVDATKKFTTPSNEPRIFIDPSIGLSPPTCGADPAVGDTIEVRKQIGVGRLRRLGMTGLGTAVAIVDNGINLQALRAKGLNPLLDAAASWSPRTGILPGAAPLDHGTMCAYDILIGAPQATLLDYSVLQSTRSGGSVVNGLLSDAVIAYGKLLTLIALPQDEREFHSLIVNNSWGMFSWSWDFPRGHPGRYGDNLNHPFNRQVASLCAGGADILFAAGNCGPTCPDSRCDDPPLGPTITGANSHPDVITVAGVDTKGQLVGYSSIGPGALHHDKPDIAAFTHFLGSEAFGRGLPDSGTSAACPVMSGVVAALRSSFPLQLGRPQRSPSSIKQFVIYCARNPFGTVGWRNDIGHGIVDTVGFSNPVVIS